MLNLPWRAEFWEYGGYDCMTAAWTIYNSKGETVATLECGGKLGERKDNPTVKACAEAIVEAVNKFGEPR